MWTLQESLLPGNRAVFVLGGRVIDHSNHSFKSVPIPLTDWVLQKHDRDDRSKDKSVDEESTLPAIWNPAYIEARMAAGTAMADAKFLDIS